VDAEGRRGGACLSVDDGENGMLGGCNLAGRVINLSFSFRSFGCFDWAAAALGPFSGDGREANDDLCPTKIAQRSQPAGCSMSTTLTTRDADRSSWRN
jgi:hypothetical protein